MIKQILFMITLLAALGYFSLTVVRLISYFQITRPFPVKDFGKRFRLMMQVAFGQTKIFRLPVIGFLHALVFWGFCVILLGSLEMIIDGLTGSERVFSSFGIFYDLMMAAGDVFAYVIALCILIFLFRRLFLFIKRFEGVEMTTTNHRDANFALFMIFLLMITLAAMNIAYVALYSEVQYVGTYPVSAIIATHLSAMPKSGVHLLYEGNWWSHILLVFFFANCLPYSKHFHVFMSVPNVFLSRLEPLGKLPNMDIVTKEVKAMLGDAAPASDKQEEIGRFGVLDIEDITWKNYFDSLACTQCGRCTSVCPANITGKKLSPRKIIMDVRARMKEKAPGIITEGSDYADGKSLINSYIKKEELWACTTCNACAQECPININHPTLIVDMRRYLVMEEAAAPAGLNAIFSNIENNGAPWQFSQQDRLLWTEH